MVHRLERQAKQRNEMKITFQNTDYGRTFGFFTITGNSKDSVENMISRMERMAKDNRVEAVEWDKEEKEGSFCYSKHMVDGQAEIRKIWAGSR